MGGYAVLQRKGQGRALQSQELRLGVPKEPTGDLGPDGPRRGREAIRERRGGAEAETPQQSRKKLVRAVPLKSGRSQLVLGFSGIPCGCS